MRVGGSLIELGMLDFQIFLIDVCSSNRKHKRGGYIDGAVKMSNGIN